MALAYLSAYLCSRAQALSLNLAKHAQKYQKFGFTKNNILNNAEEISYRLYISFNFYYLVKPYLLEMTLFK